MPPGSAMASRRAATIDTVAKYVSIIFDNIADVDSYRELHSIVWRNVRIAFDHTALNIDNTTHRVQRADEFDQEPIELRIAGSLDDPSATRDHCGFDPDPHMFLQPEVWPCSSMPANRPYPATSGMAVSRRSKCSRVGAPSPFGCDEFQRD